MKSKIDIERDRNLARLKSIQNKKFKNRKNKILHSKRFLFFMERLVDRYANGKSQTSLPYFSSQLFAELACETFNSYDFACAAVLSAYNRIIKYVKRAV